ncbi:MAG: RMD1 family protein [Verrucomicrobia bacterium]|nr:RMD1 family protein [Verrucomicrobiota bacterium]
MRCTCYCTASSYDIPRLYQHLQPVCITHLFRDVIHVQIKEDRRNRGDIFYFSYGALVCWGFSEDEEREIIDSVKEFERESLQKFEIDEFTFAYGDANKIEEDEIILQNKSPLTKLAISHGLAQSVKLTTFEELIQKTIDHTEDLPRHLAKKGKIPLSRKEISQKMGEIFIERNFINLHSEILDTPEFFWNYPELEPFYRRTAHYLDVNKRVEILNKRLNVVHELFEILSSELNHQHTSRLELIIVLLILIEVTLALLRDLFHVI